ncbi:hypothetical protein ABFS83_01G091700 [Erythranthe nasuta]
MSWGTTMKGISFFSFWGVVITDSIEFCGESIQYRSAILIIHCSNLMSYTYDFCIWFNDFSHGLFDWVYMQLVKFWYR